jgi:periplasmic copper chaperone A
MKFFVTPRVAAWVGALIASSMLSTATFAAEAVSVRNAWVRATVPGQNTAGAYMELTCESSCALLAVESPAAEKAELHAMSMDGGVMRMRRLSKIDLPAKKSVKLDPGGLHVMLINVKRPLKEGDKVPLTLTVQGAGDSRSMVTVDAGVRSVGAIAQHQHH